MVILLARECSAGLGSAVESIVHNYHVCLFNVRWIDCERCGNYRNLHRGIFHWNLPFTFKNYGGSEKNPWASKALNISNKISPEFLNPLKRRWKSSHDLPVFQDFYTENHQQNSSTRRTTKKYFTRKRCFSTWITLIKLFWNLNGKNVYFIFFLFSLLSLSYILAMISRKIYLTTQT